MKTKITIIAAIVIAIAIGFILLRAPTVAAPKQSTTQSSGYYINNSAEGL